MRPHSLRLFQCCLTLVVLVAPCRATAAVLASCGFETSGDTWSLYSTSGGSCNTQTGATTDTPPGQRILSGSCSWISAGNETSTVTFSSVPIYGWNASITYHVSSTAGTNSGKYHRGEDYVSAFVNDQSVTTVCGSVTLNWGYNSNSYQRAYKSSGTATAGVSTFTITDIPGSVSTLAFKLQARSFTDFTYWNIDDVVLNGTATTSNNRYWVKGQTDWNGSVTSWSTSQNGTASVPWNNANGDNAYFASAGGTAAITSGTVAVRSLTFSADACAVVGVSTSRLIFTDGGSGGPGANAVHVDESCTAAINARILKNRELGLTKTGTGTLVLGGSNYYTGTTSITAGIVRISENRNLGADGSKISFNNGTLQFSAGVDLASNHPIEFLSGGGSLDTLANNCSANVAGWTGDGTMIKTGAGKLLLSSGSSSFSGNVDVRQGTLHLESSNVLQNCSQITVEAGAAIELPNGELYSVGASGKQTLFGAGNVLSNLKIAAAGVHEVGSSPNTQTVYGDYTMAGKLSVELFGDLVGDGKTGYDQLIIDKNAGDSKFDVALSGELSITWKNLDWSSGSDQLCIIWNKTEGDLSSQFQNYANNDVVGQCGDRLWTICYGADFEIASLSGGNDVVLAATPIPEPASLCLLLTLVIANLKMGCLGKLCERRRLPY